MVRPAPERPGSHLGRRAPAFTFIAPRGFDSSPLTRARVRLLGPCFKTGLVGSRHRRRPLAPAVRGPVPARAARRGQDALGAVRPGRQSRRGRGAPCPAAAGQGAEIHDSTAPGGNGEVGEARCKARHGASRPSHLRAVPSRPTQSRSRRTAAEKVRPAGAGAPGLGSANRIPRHRAAGHERRVESSGRTARTPPVYLLTVSRPVELSLQSSFQLSLTVLVRYRSRAGI